VIDLADLPTRLNLVAQIEKDVDAYCREAFPSEHRTHLGASVIADPCAAKAWGTFRWLKLEQHNGRMRRLFERGHLEESRFVRLLRGIGFEIKEFDADGKQFRVSGVDGHFGGSLDALAKAPARYEIPDEIIIVNEYKTHGEKSFAKLAGPKRKLPDETPRRGGEGVRVSKPIHYGQMCSYGRAYGYRWALYVAVNKDTDELYFEIVYLDFSFADDLFRKADFVIHSQTQPAKISLVETYFGCKTCHFSPICFRGELPEKNCRSCEFSVPIAGGQWGCTNPAINQKRDFVEPMMQELIATGCDHWRAIINAA
jgi:hypothetical protein